MAPQKQQLQYLIAGGLLVVIGALVWANLARYQDGTPWTSGPGTTAGEARSSSAAGNGTLIETRPPAKPAVLGAAPAGSGQVPGGPAAPSPGAGVDQQGALAQAQVDQRPPSTGAAQQAPETTTAGSARRSADQAGYRLLRPVGFAASSAFARGKEVHPAQHAFDGRQETAWNDGTAGSGAGEWLEAQFASPQRLRRIVVSTGYTAYSRQFGDLFAANAHLRRVRLEFGDGSSARYGVERSERMLVIDDLDRVTDRVRIVAEDVYEGQKWQDLAISEVSFWGGEAERVGGDESSCPSAARPDPARARILTERGQALWRGGDFEQAAAVWLQAYEVDPELELALDQRTRALLKAGRYPACTLAAQQCLACATTPHVLASCYGGLGSCRKELGDRAAARAAFERSLKLEETGQVRALLDALASGE